MRSKLLIRQLSPHFIAFFLTASFFYIFLLLQRGASDYIKGMNGFDWVYLPAGIAFVGILIGGLSAVLGLFFVLITNYTINYPDVYLPVIVLLVMFSMMVQLIVIKSYLYLLGIGKNLEGLKHIQLIGLALLFSLSHSLCHHLNIVTIAGHHVGWAESMITLSTFLGIFCILILLWSFSKLHNYFFAG